MALSWHHHTRYGYPFSKTKKKGNRGSLPRDLSLQVWSSYPTVEHQKEPPPTYLKGTHLRKLNLLVEPHSVHGLLTPSGKGFPPEGRWNAFLSQWIWLLSFPRTLSRDPQRPLFTKSAHIREIVHAISLYPKLSHNPLFHFKKKVWSYLRSISSSSIV